MPNHVTNKLLFHPCTEQRFNEILADLQKEGAEPGSIDLGRIIPEPEGLFMGDLGVEEMKKYKDNNWYDWRIKHWNTKWNAYGFEPPTFSGDTGTMTFRTANCSPFPVIFRLSKKYPDVEIDLRYADEDIGYNVGEITVCAGELIDDNSPQYGSATAQELAADILGLNLDFDLNTGSGYVVSLLGNYYEYCNNVYPAFVKINASNNNMMIYLRGRYYGVLSASYSRGSCSIYAPSSSINDHVDFSRPDPENDNFNVTLNVPSWALGKLSKVIDIIPITFNILLSTIKVNLSKHSVTLYDNSVVWNHNYSRDLTWTDSSPSETTNGYTGRIMMTYMKKTNAGQMFTISATGQVGFSFSGNDAGVPFNGAGTFKAQIVTKAIYIDSNAS